MKVILCSWCDKPAQHKRTLDGERTNSDACCDRHYAVYFARHKGEVDAAPDGSTAGDRRHFPVMYVGRHRADIPYGEVLRQARAERRPVVVADAATDEWLLGGAR